MGAIPQAIQRLKELQINFLALDFDQTILNIHTGGRWQGTLEELLPHVRPVFLQLIPAAQEAGLEVAVVTFSRQVSLVRGVLDTIMTSSGIELANPSKPSGRIPIRGNDRSWSYTGKGSRMGKQAYMASAVEELEYRFQSDNLHITRQSSLLIDDDAQNCKIALQNGVRAIWFNPDKPHRLLPEMIKLQ
jgi:hypothetical protein